MELRAQQAPYCVYGLADHLDAILAACEDLHNASTARVDVRSFELSALSHALQARRCLQDLWIDDDGLSHEATLFLIATRSLVQVRGVGSNPEVVGADAIGGHVLISVIADRASAVLDVLEGRFGELWAEPGDAPSRAVPPNTPASVWSS
jgi:hypothetical protein